MNELIVDKIRWLMELPEMYSEPGKGGFFISREEKSIIRWTLMELALAIMDHPNRDAFKTIDQFWLQMMCYRQEATSPKVHDTFEVVVNAVETIRLYL